MAKAPKGLKYTNDHEWVNVEGNIATVGITEFASGELGDIVYVEVDSIDDYVEKDDVLGTIEAVKTVSDLFSPVSGDVIEFNPSVNADEDGDPEKVNDDPYGEGWIVKIKIGNPDELESLLSAEEYAEITGSEIV